MYYILNRAIIMYVKKNLQKAKKLIDSVNTIYLLIHKSPDPDALGSAVAMFEFLRSEGKSVYVYSPTKISEWQSFITEGVEVNILQNNQIPKAKDGDLLVYLDGGEYSRFSEDGVFIPPTNLTTLKFDHHPVEDEISDFTVYSNEVSSTAEIIYDFLYANKVKISENIAKAILIGIIGDTGWFKYEITTPRSLKIAADLLKINDCLTYLDYHFNRSLKVHTLAAWKLLMENLVVVEERSVLYSYVNYENISSLNFTKEDFATAYHTFLDEIMRVFSDIDISALILEIEKNKLHGSLRSETGTVNIGNVCSTFEIGGGHPNAGGFTTQKSVDETLQQIYQGIAKYKLI